MTLQSPVLLSCYILIISYKKKIQSDKRIKTHLRCFDRNVRSGLLPRPNVRHVRGEFKSTYCSLKSTHVLCMQCTHSQTNIPNHRLSWLSFAKQRVLLSCHATCPCFMLICRFSLAATLRPDLNNAGALLNCNANTAGLSAFSCFVGVFFFS